MQYFAVAAHTHWHDPLEPGFDVQSIPQSPYEGVGHLSEPCTFGRMTESLQLNDSTHICGWCANGSPCNEFYPPGDNLEAYHFEAYQLASIQRLLVVCTRTLQQHARLVGLPCPCQIARRYDPPTRLTR